MLSKIFFIAVLGIALCIEVTDIELASEFGNFIRDHDREYSTVEETLKRFKIFTENYNFIKEYNAKSNNVQLGINQFADLTREEIRSMYLNPKVSHDLGTPCTGTHHKSGDSQEVDWRKKNAVTRVKNQGSCGSCWAFSAIGSVEGLHAIQSGSLVEYSEQELVDCSHKQNEGCNGGFMDYALDYIKDNGIAKESDYIYTARDGRCKKVPRSYQIKNCVAIEGANNNQLLEGLNIVPVSVSVKADDPRFTFYKSGVFDDYTATKDELDHGVLLIGATYKDKTPCWIIKNSWGRGWGQSGLAYIKRDIGRGPSICGIAEDSCYAI